MNKKTQKEILNIVKKNYSEIAGHYSETRKKELWPELVYLTKNVSANARVLDVGCGSGKLLKALQEKKIYYLGIDPSVELLKQAKEQFSPVLCSFSEEGNFKFSKGDILNLGAVNELNFDYIFCIAVLQHIPGKDLQIKALKQLKNKLSKNGKIILSVWNLWNQEKYRELIWKFWLLKLINKNKMDFGDILFDWKNPQGERVSKRYYHAFRLFELKRIIKKSGLKIEKIYKDKYNIYAIIKN
ncbi:methyltransferase domain-containing protein [Candidatus Parcubacteria bacterium]|nr:methyltransferase domain-containing protein [Candidatus Parcubacteria bacterium]